MNSKCERVGGVVTNNTHTHRTKPSSGSYLLQVTGGSSRDLSITKDNLLSGTSTQSPNNASKYLLLADESWVLPRNEPC